MTSIVEVTEDESSSDELKVSTASGVGTVTRSDFSTEAEDVILSPTLCDGSISEDKVRTLVVEGVGTGVD